MGGLDSTSMSTYLDHAATTPIRPVARDAVLAQMARVGNPSSLHSAGRAARRVLEESREAVADALGARPSEVIFTSGGTESDNIALLGSFLAVRQADPARDRVVLSGMEHHAVLDAATHLADTSGARLTFVEPGECGTIEVDAVRAAVEEDPASVAVVSVMWANNEVGTVQDVAAMARLCHEHAIPFHTDAVQVAGHLPVDFAAVEADTLAVSGHKFGGPTGAGVLLARRDARPVPTSHGGGQERSLRSGTVAVAGIAGLAAALTEAVGEIETEAVRVAALRDRFLTRAREIDPSIRVSGCWELGDVTRRLPGNAHITIPGCDGDSLLYLLDAAGVEVSTGSACQAGVPQPSHVLLAMGRSEEETRGSLRVSLGWTSTEADVDAALSALPDAVDRARRASGAA